jgi:hypothetical protein
MDHSYEELRDVALDILSGRERGSFGSDQYQHLKTGIAEVLESRSRNQRVFNAKLSSHDSELFLELFWDLFRQGIITLGLNDDNREFPFFRVSSFGKKLIEGQNPYFFHDVSSYEKVILSSVPQVDTITLIYLKEAMQAFMSGCLLSCSVMLGVATEHSFLKLLDVVEANTTYNSLFKNAFSQKTILQKLNKFKNVLDQNLSILSSEAKEDLDTNFSGIISMIRTFRNESGHPSGRIISREQCYILLQLFIPCCKKIYQLIDALK